MLSVNEKRERSYEEGKVQEVEGEIAEVRMRRDRLCEDEGVGEGAEE